MMLTSADNRAWWASIVVAALIVLPLALNVPLYFDDVGRSLSGSYGWSEDGRPLADHVVQLRYRRQTNPNTIQKQNQTYQINPKHLEI